MKHYNLIGVLALFLTSPALAQGVDPLEAEVNSVDAHRFVEVFEAADGAPSAEQLQAGYLDGAGRGVEIFTPNRIESAENLASTIAQNTELYRRAIDVCLPIAMDSSRELQSIYLGLTGLLPDRELPEIHVVFGANNSGGTAGSNAQVLGLEVVCRINETEAEIRAFLRHMYAHETVHVLQGGRGLTPENTLLTASLGEGVADFIAYMVTAQIPDVDRNNWAHENAEFVWNEFLSDWQTLNEMTEGLDNINDAPDEAYGIFRRWHSNAGSPPEGWPSELGYWVGRQIAQAYFDNAENKRAALDYLLGDFDPIVIWEDSGFADQFGTPD